MHRLTYKTEEESETDQTKSEDEIPDPREIIDISFQYADDDMNVGALEETHTKIYQNNDLEKQDSTQSGDDDDDDDDTVKNEEDSMGKTPIYQMNEQNREDIIKLQKHCPSFKHMYRFLKDGILPEDPDKAKSIPYESNTYVLLNDVLYHIWTTKIRKKNRESDIVQQLIGRVCINIYMIIFYLVKHAN